MKSIEIDRGKRLRDQPTTGHNRFHPDIPPLVTVDEGEEVVLATRDGVDGQLGPGTSEADIAKMEAGAIHPLTGPVFIKGAKPGDVLEVEFLDIVPQPHAFTAIVPGLGFLRDLFTTPFLVHWQIRDGWATAQKLPGVRIPGAPFMGVSGVAPSAAQVRAWTARENELMGRGGGAADLRISNVVDVPNYVVSALLPEANFAQGDGEVCVTAVEMGATVSVRFRVLKGSGAARALRGPRFSHAGYFAPPEWASPRGFVAAMGMPIRDDGVNEGENLTLACRNALLNMIDLLQERGWSREQAYVLCSVAVDLRISNVVDVPNYVVSALIPEAIFGG